MSVYNTVFCAVKGSNALHINVQRRTLTELLE